MVVDAHNPSTEEAEAGGSSLRLYSKFQTSLNYTVWLYLKSINDFKNKMSR